MSDFEVIEDILRGCGIFVHKFQTPFDEEWKEWAALWHHNVNFDERCVYVKPPSGRVVHAFQLEPPIENAIIQVLSGSTAYTTTPLGAIDENGTRFAFPTFSSAAELKMKIDLGWKLKLAITEDDCHSANG